ncbi:MAG: hypothetical protein HY279_10315 [Nitrospinae bacterium]|nr:hypothetical protein [Nitrospinota bacterium]
MILCKRERELFVSPLPSGERIEVRGGFSKEWLLEIALPTIDYIELYIPESSGGFQVKRAGRSMPFNERDIGHRNFVFPLIPAQELEQTYYLRFKSEDGIFLPMTLWSKDHFYKKSYKEYIFPGVYYGAISIMVLYNLFVFISLRDRNYLLKGWLSTKIVL